MKKYFYHCFPRRSADNAIETVDKGFKILESIVEEGLLLTPEIIKIQEPLDDGTFSKPWSIIEKRCCFTELSEEELPKHQEVFGQFALEFEIPTLRHLGAIPTFYIPAGKHDDTGMEYVANSLMCRVGEIQVVLDRLKQLDSLVKSTNNKNEVLNIAKNGKAIGTTRCNIGGAEDLINYLTHETQPIEILGNALRVLSQYFYPTENLEYNKELTYYRQREWRIIGNMMHHGKELTSKLENSTVKKLNDIDEEFFNRVLEFHTGKYKIYEQCLILREYMDKPIIHYVNRIHVPKEAKKAVETLLAKASIKIEIIEN